MRLSYELLLRVSIRNAYYADLRSRDFLVTPSRRCLGLLAQYGFLFRSRSDGFSLIAQVEPDSDPPLLWRPPGDNALKFTFLLKLENPYFLQAADMPGAGIAGKVYYFNNLQDDVQDDDRYLTDSQAGERLGPPVRLVTGTQLTYELESPATGAEVVLEDLLGNERRRFSFPQLAAGSRSLLLDLDIAEGRYLLRDDQGGTLPVYYDPALAGEEAFGIIELFSRTSELTTDGSDTLPGTYRFIEDDAVTGRGEYVISIPARETIWHYNIHKKYEASTVEPDDLAIGGSIDFTRTDISDGVRFTSDEPVPLSETRPKLELRKNGSAIGMLPIPSMKTPLREEDGQDHFISAFNVYV